MVCFFFSSSLYGAGIPEPLVRTNRYIEKDYYTILVSLTLLLPELVEFNFSDNGTFLLTSDLWDEPAQGTYEKGLCFLRGTATSKKFFDTDFDEEIQMSYNFFGIPLGLRDFFLFGVGLRHITFFSDNATSREYFIFEGPGT
jgi:hypothetical protein